MRIGTTEILFFIGLALLILFTIEIIKFLNKTFKIITKKINKNETAKK